MRRTFIFILLLLLFFRITVFSQNQHLDYYISAGLHNSALLKDYGNRIRSNAFDSLKIVAGQRPQASVFAQALYAPVSANFGYDSAITNGGNYAALISVNQPLFRNHFRNSQFENIALLNQSLAANATITENDLKKSITAQYITAYSDYTLVEFSRSILQLLNGEETLLRTLVEKGIYLQSDYLNLSVSIRALEISITQDMLQYKNDIYSLNILCGIFDTSTVTLSKPELQAQTNIDIHNSPLMLQFKIDSLKNINSKTLVDLNYKPKLTAFADAGFNSINPKNVPHNFGTSVGVNFSMPIYDGRQRKIEYGKISLAEVTRAAYKDFYQTQFQSQVQQLKERLAGTNELIIKINNQLTEQQKLIDLYKLEIEKGLVRFTDFITATNNYFNTRYSLKQSEINRQQIINELNYIK